MSGAKRDSEAFELTHSLFGSTSYSFILVIKRDLVLPKTDFSISSLVDQRIRSNVLSEWVNDTETLRSCVCEFEIHIEWAIYATKGLILIYFDMDMQIMPVKLLMLFYTIQMCIKVIQWKLANYGIGAQLSASNTVTEINAHMDKWLEERQSWRLENVGMRFWELVTFDWRPNNICWLRWCECELVVVLVCVGCVVCLPKYCQCSMIEAKSGRQPNQTHTHTSNITEYD